MAVLDVSRPGPQLATHERRAAIFRDAVEILQRDFAQPLTIELVARRVASSPRQLQRAFAEVGGVGFRTLLIRIRIARAADLLANTDLPVKAVSESVGYQQPGHLAKAFKRAWGLSPQEYRMASRGAPQDP